MAIVPVSRLLCHVLAVLVVGCVSDGARIPEEVAKAEAVETAQRGQEERLEVEVSALVADYDQLTRTLADAEARFVSAQ